MFGGNDDEGGDVADEGDWYAALVAGEHVGEWLDIVKVRASACQACIAFFSTPPFFFSFFFFCLLIDSLFFVIPFALAFLAGQGKVERQEGTRGTQSRG